MYVVMNGKRLQERREEKGLSRRDLANAAGISVDTVRRAEYEEPVRGKTGKKMAGALGVHYRSIGQPYYEPERAAVMGAVAGDIYLRRPEQA